MNMITASENYYKRLCCICVYTCTCMPSMVMLVHRNVLRDAYMLS